MPPCHFSAILVASVLLPTAGTRASVLAGLARWPAGVSRQPATDGADAARKSYQPRVYRAGKFLIGDTGASMDGRRKVVTGPSLPSKMELAGSGTETESDSVLSMRLVESAREDKARKVERLRPSRTEVATTMMPTEHVGPSAGPAVGIEAPGWNWAKLGVDPHTTLLKFIPPVTSQLLSLAPMVDVHRIQRQGSCGKMSPVSYVAMIVSGAVWWLYGVLTDQATIWVSSLISLLLGSYYLRVLSRYSTWVSQPCSYICPGQACF
jgi:uncharacterized protein with PQ loop repeat